ncbi:hypothetical protein [Pseudomonas sp. RIT-PI-S]|uniref:hypothetical protein n=1 Tax=Pseudomonas sp. RIT-PI-S TaxID=3035295 RepID=UPI0021D93109|nr:hypothetical protein [Pseudomonas sp. RIT-PI-S]
MSTKDKPDAAPEAFVKQLSMPKSPVEQAIDALKNEGEERVLLIGNTLCIFAENVPASVAEDVAASMRLIGLSSEKAFDKETQQREWYNHYTHGLAKLGWTMTGAAHAEEAMDQEKSTLAEVAISIISRDLGAKHRMARCLGRSFQAMTHAPAAQRLFERSTISTTGKSSTFQAVDCEMSPQGLPIMHMKSFQIAYDRAVSTGDAITREFEKSSTRVYRASQQGTFSIRQFQILRDAVTRKLASQADDILDLSI